MSGNEVWLIRHGETEWSASGRHTSSTDLALTPEGERKAVAVGRLLAGKAFALVLASPLRRALETCRLAGYSPEVTPDLREWGYGAYEGLTTAEIQVQKPGWTIWNGTPPGGESAEEVGARADRVIARAAAANGDVALSWPWPYVACSGGTLAGIGANRRPPPGSLDRIAERTGL